MHAKGHEVSHTKGTSPVGVQKMGKELHFLRVYWRIVVQPLDSSDLNVRWNVTVFYVWSEIGLECFGTASTTAWLAFAYSSFQFQGSRYSHLPGPLPVVSVFSNSQSPGPLCAHPRYSTSTTNRLGSSHPYSHPLILYSQIFSFFWQWYSLNTP